MQRGMCTCMAHRMKEKRKELPPWWLLRQAPCTAMWAALCAAAVLRAFGSVGTRLVLPCNYRLARMIVQSRGGSTYGPNRHHPPFWQINHANSACFRLFLGYFGVLYQPPGPPFGSRPPFYISWIRPCNQQVWRTFFLYNFVDFWQQSCYCCIVIALY